MKRSILMLFGVFILSLLFVSPVRAKKCPKDSEQSGPVCVDKYEASVWETTDKKTIKKIQRGKIKSAADLGGATQRGDTSDDYGAGCPDTGNGCTDFYAVSIPGVTPSGFISWFQAAAACRNSDKRLLTNQEWQVAALGTPDPGTDDDNADCNIFPTVGGDPVDTGSRSNCVSDMGVFDMVGNLYEWVADWIQDNDDVDGTASSSAVFGNDDSFGIDEAFPEGNGFPGALRRGGGFNNGVGAGVFALDASGGPALSFFNDIGFRCAR